MAATLDRWLRWNLYLLAAAPNAGVAGVRVTDAGLEITVANDGLIALDVDAAVQTQDGLHRRTFASLSGEARMWTVPLADRNKATRTSIGQRIKIPADILTKAILIGYGLVKEGQCSTIASAKLSYLDSRYACSGAEFAVLYGRAAGGQEQPDLPMVPA